MSDNPLWTVGHRRDPKYAKDGVAQRTKARLPFAPAVVGSDPTPVDRLSCINGLLVMILSRPSFSAKPRKTTGTFELIHFPFDHSKKVDPVSRAKYKCILYTNVYNIQQTPLQ